MSVKIHPSSVIDSSAKFGEDVEVGPFCVIGPNVQLGDKTKLISHVSISYTKTGESCVFYPSSSIGLEPQHLGYKGEPSSVVMGDRNVFREGVTIHRGSPAENSITILGNDNYLMAYSHVAHDCKVGNKVVMANNVLLAGHVTIQDNVFISGAAAFYQFSRVGRGSIVSGGTMAIKDVAPFCIAQGDRAKIRGLNIVGMRRLGMDRNSRELIKRAYKAIFLNALTIEEALKHPDVNVDNEFVKQFKEFFSQSKRGFLRPPIDAISDEAVGDDLL
ncbi:MAG: acyl-ACP--UDP-N-acetylglucosamine O-acyltransferase [Elusimicrobiota bacterium]